MVDINACAHDEPRAWVLHGSDFYVEGVDDIEPLVTHPL